MTDERYLMSSSAYKNACAQLDVAAIEATGAMRRRSANRKFGRWKQSQKTLAKQRSQIEQIIEHCKQPGELLWIDEQVIDGATPRQTASELLTRLQSAKVVPVAGWNLVLSFALRWVLPWLVDWLVNYFTTAQMVFGMRNRKQ